jgi:hypothetical protein
MGVFYELATNFHVYTAQGLQLKCGFKNTSRGAKTLQCQLQKLIAKTNTPHLA